jgi:hypothetical protein
VLSIQNGLGLRRQTSNDYSALRTFYSELR